MVYFTDSQQWIHQSTLLLEAYPTTTRITTKYTIRSPSSKPLTTTTPPTTSTPTTIPRASAFLTLKTYDPISSTCLKYRTDKAAEVGRLIAGLGACGRVMAGVSVVPKEEKEGGGGGKEKKEGEGEQMEGDVEQKEGVTAAAAGMKGKEKEKETKTVAGAGAAAGKGKAGSNTKKKKGKK